MSKILGMGFNLIWLNPSPLLPFQKRLVSPLMHTGKARIDQIQSIKAVSSDPNTLGEKVPVGLAGQVRTEQKAEHINYAEALSPMMSPKPAEPDDIP